MKKFRVFMLAALSILLLSSIVACGTTKVSGEEKTYSNAAKTFSVQLPAEDKGSWKVNKDATDDVLDLSDEKRYDQCSDPSACQKTEAEYIATDLDSYEQYAMINTLEDLLSSMKLKETKVDTPDFITKTDAQSITLEDGENTVKGIVVFMESDSSYYTYLIMAVDKTYDANEDVLLSSIMSLKEL